MTVVRDRTPAEVARELGKNVQTVRDWAWRGCPHNRSGAGTAVRYSFAVDEVKAWLRRRVEAQDPPPATERVEILGTFSYEGVVWHRVRCGREEEGGCEKCRRHECNAWPARCERDFGPHLIARVTTRGLLDLRCNRCWSAAVQRRRERYATRRRA